MNIVCVSRGKTNDGILSLQQFCRGNEAVTAADADDVFRYLFMVMSERAHTRMFTSTKRKLQRQKRIVNVINVCARASIEHTHGSPMTNACHCGMPGILNMCHSIIFSCVCAPCVCFLRTFHTPHTLLYYVRNINTMKNDATCGFVIIIVIIVMTITISQPFHELVWTHNRISSTFRSAAHTHGWLFILRANCAPAAAGAFTYCWRLITFHS